MIDITGVHSVLVFVEDWVGAAEWWALVVAAQVVERQPLAATVHCGPVEIVFRPPDYRNPPGGSPVIYLRVNDFNSARRKFRSSGAVELHYPLEIPGGLQLTQFRDPFATIFGIVGAVTDEGGVWPEIETEISLLRRAFGDIRR